MKTLTTDQETARAAGGHSVSRFLSLGGNNGAGGVLYSMRDPNKVFSPESGWLHLKMEDNAATPTVVDSIGRYDQKFVDPGGDPNTDAHTTAGVTGAGFVFDGVDDTINIPLTNYSAPLAEGHDFTVSMWWKTNGPTGTQYFLSNRIGGKSSFYWFTVGGNVVLAMQFWVGGVLKSAPNVTFSGGDDGLWHHYAATRSGTTIKYYRDGSLAGTFTNSFSSGSLSGNGKVLSIGSNLGSFSPGSADDFRLYGRSWSLSFIQGLYNSGRGTSGDFDMHLIIPTLSDWNQRERSADKGISTLPKIQRFGFSIRITDEYGIPIDQQVEDAIGGFQGKEVIAYKVLKPASGMVTSVDWIEMFRGEVETVSQSNPQEVTFDCVDFSKYAGTRKSLRQITTNLFPTAPEMNLGDVMPVIIGQIDNVPGIQVTQGASSTLAASLQATDDEMTVADTTVFSATGRVQVGNEKIAYSGINTVASLLTGLTRDETASDHPDGAVVTQLQDIRFLIADQSLESGFGAAGTVRDAHGAVLQQKGTDAEGVRIFGYEIAREEIPAGSGNSATFIDVEDEAFPPITEVLSSTTKKDLAEDLDDESLTRSDWQVGPRNEDPFDTMNPLNAVDSNEATKHVTAATISVSETERAWFHLEQIKDLSAQTGDIKKVIAFVEYAIIPARDQDWPNPKPEFNVTVGGSNVSQSVLGEPTEMDADTKLFPESDPDAPTTDLFETTGPPLGNVSTYSPVFSSVTNEPDNSGTDNTQEWFTDAPANHFSFYWDGFGGFSPGDTILWGQKVIRCSVFSVLGGTERFTAFSPFYAKFSNLFVKLDPTDTSLPDTATEVVVKANVIGDTTLDSDSNTVSVNATARLRIMSGLTTRATVYLHNITSAGSKLIKATFSSSLTLSDLKSLRFVFDSPDITPGGSFMGEFEDKCKYLIQNVTVDVTAGTAINGQTDPIDSTSIVPSQRVRQTQLITSIVAAGGGWDWFGGRGGGFEPGISLYFDAQDNDYIIKVYNVGWEVELLETSSRVTLPSEYTLRADTTGLTGTTATTISAEQWIDILFGTPDLFYGLPAARLDRTSLATSLAIVAQGLDSQDKDDWIFRRRITEDLTNRELLRQSLTEAGIRAVIEGGQLKFFPQISADPANEPSVRSIDSDKTRTPVRTTTNIVLVVNDLILRYAESLISPGLFEGEVKSINQASVDAIKSRVSTLDTFFIRDSDVATALAEHLTSDFALSRSLVSTAIEGGRGYDLEVGDVVTLSDSYTRFAGMLARITDLTPGIDDERTIDMILALSNKSTVIWQHGSEGDADFSKIEINTLTGALLFTVDNVRVGTLSSTGFAVLGNVNQNVLAASVLNVVTQANPALERNGATSGLVEYISAATAGLSHGLIGFAVYNGGDSNFYRVMSLGYNTDAGSNFHDSLFLNDYSDNTTLPFDMPDSAWAVSGMTWDGLYITQTNRDDNDPGEDGNLVMTADLLRLYMIINKFLDGGAINGQLVVKGLSDNVPM